MSDNAKIILVGVAFVLILLGLLAIARIPGNIARRRGHVSADAINICAWVGVFFTFSIFWWVALIWAHTGPDNSASVAAKGRVAAPKKPPKGYVRGASLNYQEPEPDTDAQIEAALKRRA